MATVGSDYLFRGDWFDGLLVVPLFGDERLAGKLTVVDSDVPPIHRLCGATESAHFPPVDRAHIIDRNRYQCYQ